ncbi:MAG: Gfo/Idh/MocA family oxidoreductase [Clostridia bacterium]|nr:Gfo/Idh/MocA family oxidoreductase [Clostridia bacterium]MBQ4243518.1 Gfo/Idh/MocA family oxidoreductase [Clostridia bacterium]
MAGILDRFKEEIAEKTEIDLSKKIKVGIIGTGWIAEAHVNAYKKCPDVEIIAAADLIPGKAEAFCKANGLENIKFYPSHKELIDEAGVDAVSVCTYNATHAECTIYALDHGVSVLLEKPMCVTLDEAVEICRAEKRNNAVLSIGFQPRFDENMKMLKKICQSGELGKIYYIQTGGGRRRGIPTPYGTSFIEKETAGIGALGDIGCYSLDMVLNSIGYPKPLTVSGYKSAYFGKDPSYEHHDVFGVDDFAAGFIRLEGDIILDFRIAWAMNLDTPGDTIIMGTKGSVRVPSTECWNGSIGGPLVIYHEIAGNQVETIVEEKHNDTDCFDIKIRSFVDAVKNGGEAPVPCSQILYNQAIIDGISRSAELGREIAIEIPEI